MEYRIYWLRHGAAGSLDIDAGVRVQSGELAGFIRERSGVRIEDPALGALIGKIENAARGNTDLHLPVLERRRVRAGNWAAECDCFAVAPGVLLVNADEPSSVLHRNGYAESVVALACYPWLCKSQPAIAPDLTYSYSRDNTTCDDLTALAARYGIDPPTSSDGSFDATLTVSIPGDYLSAWLISPRQVTNRFYWTYTAISAQLQQMLRAWLRFQWFADLANFNDLVASRAAIMYWMSAPHKGKARSEFTYDVLSPENVKKLCRVGPRKFASELDVIHDRLREAGKDQAAECYRRLHTREIMDAVKRERRTIARMISIESEIVDILINFAVGARELSESRHDVESPNSGARLVDLAAEVMRALRATLRRFPVRGAEHDLAILTLIEATAQLRRSLGLPGNVEALLFTEKNSPTLALAS